MERKADKRRKGTGQDAETAGTDVKIAKQDDASSAPSSTVSGSVAVQTSPYFYNQDGYTEKLGRSFFDVPCITLAKNLLGQFIVRLVGSQRITGRIVETEAYIGPEDKAAHSYQGKRTPKNESMFLIPGTSYVYNIYGMYCCLNISSQGDGAAVLIRALEPIDGHDLMEEGRKGKTDNNKKRLKDKDLTNGPSKLCQALHINKKDFDKVDLTSSDTIWLEKGVIVEPESIVSCARINIGYAEDWKDRPLRFYMKGNKCVSARDKTAEKEMEMNDVS